MPGNEPQRRQGDDDDINTYGARGNEPSKRRHEVTIYVTKGGAGRHQMTVNLNMSQDDLKQQICSELGVSSGQCYITCCGKRLSGRNTLKEAGIQNGSTVDVCMRLRGG